MTKPARNTRLGASRATALVADDACPSCGTTMKETRGRLTYPVNREDMKVAASHLRCPKCGEVVLRLEDARRLRADAIGAYRKKYRLLSAEVIARGLGAVSSPRYLRWATPRLPPRTRRGPAVNMPTGLSVKTAGVY